MFASKPLRDHRQRNAPNGALVEFRQEAGSWFAFEDDLHWWAACLNDPSFDYTTNGYYWTTAEIDHARRVLTRLSHAYEES